VFDVFRSQQVSVDVVASSEVSISLSLDPKKSWSDGEVGGVGCNQLCTKHEWVSGCMHCNRNFKLAWCVHMGWECLRQLLLRLSPNDLQARLH
jgi:hypothetical protein